MTVTIRGRDDFSLRNYERVAWGGEDVNLDQECWRQVESGRAALLRYVDAHSEVPIYGVTTGFGDLAKRVLGSEEREHQAHWLGHHRGIGVGAPYPTRVVRGMVFARLTNFVDGRAGVSRSLVSDVAAMLAQPELPMVRMRGQQSSGEVNTLLELFAQLLGDTRQLKDANSLTNGSPCASALLADSSLRARRLLGLVVKVMALVILAGGGPLAPYDLALRDAWADEYDGAALGELAGLLDLAPTDERTAFQPPVSWRIIPRVLGAAFRSLDNLERVGAASLASNTDNPVYERQAGGEAGLGRVLPTGGFHNGQACPALNGVARCWADLATLTGRFVAVLGRRALDVERELSFYALTAFHAYFARRARDAAVPTLLLAEDTFSNQTDVMSPVPYAYEKETEAVEALVACLAATAASASQGLWYRKVEPLGVLGALLDGVRERSVPGALLRSQGDEMQALVSYFSGQLFGGVDGAL
jgi:histidine ammonia-lyase